MLLAVAAKDLADVFDDFGTTPVVEALDTLLLLFILVELLSAVRITIAKRELVAEPFLLVGIIASIKEIVVLSVKAAESIGDGAIFTDQLWEIAVLGVVVLLLGVTAWLLRIKRARTTRRPTEPAGLAIGARAGCSSTGRPDHPPALAGGAVARTAEATASATTVSSWTTGSRPPSPATATRP